MGFAKYLKKAFLWNWNLLAFGAGMGLAAVDGALGGQAWQVIAPLVLAGEVAYLGLLGTHPKFQRYVEAQETKADRKEDATDPETQVRRLLSELPPRLVQRFEALRTRCQELRHIASRLRDPGQEQANRPLEEMQLAGLDKLLWTFLRLVYTQHMLERFLQQTNEGQIRKTVENLQRSLQTQAAKPDDPQGQKIRKTLEDNLKTCEERLANLQRARDHAQLVQLEIDRLENKIYSLNELAVNRQEAGFIAGQVDEVVTGMVQTERTMGELQFATGLGTTDEAVPQMLLREALPAKD